MTEILEHVEIVIPGKYHSLLEKNVFGLMTTIRQNDGLPSTNPVGFVWDGERIRVSTLKSRMKYKNIQADDRISFCVISSENIMNYLEIRGWASLEDDIGRSFSALQFRRVSGGGELPEDMDPPEAERVIVTIHPTQVSAPALYGGRFDSIKK